MSALLRRQLSKINAPCGVKFIPICHTPTRSRRRNRDRRRYKTLSDFIPTQPQPCRVTFVMRPATPCPVPSKKRQRFILCNSYRGGFTAPVSAPARKQPLRGACLYPGHRVFQSPKCSDAFVISKASSPPHMMSECRRKSGSWGCPLSMTALTALPPPTARITNVFPRESLISILGYAHPCMI